MVAIVLEHTNWPARPVCSATAFSANAQRGKRANIRNLWHNVCAT